MHKCSTCTRQFLTKGALTRHEQNHQKTHQYTCSQCKVVFYRQDLLTRHMRMHKKTGNDGATGRSRLRSRTACEACRKARTKCNGQAPCVRCQKHRLNCVFSISQGRVSTDLQVTSLPSPHADYEMLAETMDNSTEPLTNVLAPSHSTDTVEENYVPLYPSESIPGGMDPSLNSTVFSPNPIPWPWLHEDIFLQTDISLDWYDVSNAHNDDTGYSIAAQELLPHMTNSLLGHQEHISPNRSMERASELFHADQSTDENSTVRFSKEEMVDLIIELASKATKYPTGENMLRPDLVSFDKEVTELARKVPLVFQLDASCSNPTNINDCPHCLSHFVQLYLKHFWTLWPLNPRFHFKYCDFQPLLYLTMASIGAMYGGKKASVFGTMLHESLRDVLLRPLFDYDSSDRELLPLGQARSLTQAAALYFGQKRAFSYAQHMGSVLVSQGRRMNLFPSLPSRSTLELENRHSHQNLSSWIRKECYKRLAFAILRLEMYTSSLHSTRPLISAEEMHIEVPCSRFLWYTDFISAQEFLGAVQQECSMKKPGLFFSDLVRVSLDPKERLPHLELLDQELLMNAMQEYVWGACAARNSFERLVPGEAIFETELDSGLEEDNPAAAMFHGVATRGDKSVDSHLVRHARAMATIRRKMEEASIALRKWHDCCLTSEVPSQVADRSSLLSCLLIYHMGFLQLHSPLELIHTVCHLPLSTGSSQHEAIQRVRCWSTTKRALFAVLHATSIFKLLKREASTDLSYRANVNFLTMIGLYHSAALLWGFAGIGEDEPLRIEQAVSLKLECDSIQIPISKANVAPLMEAFVNLFYEINPTWAPRSSFCAAVQRLSKLPFPTV